jgi:hypothetical protein
MHTLDHQRQSRVDYVTGLLRVELLHQRGRALDIRKQHRQRLALTVGKLGGCDCGRFLRGEIKCNAGKG